MTVKLDLDPGMELQLRENAARAGLPVEDYLLSVVQREISQGILHDHELAPGADGGTIDFSTAWSDEDLEALTIVSLRYADKVYPDENELV